MVVRVLAPSVTALTLLVAGGCGRAPRAPEPTLPVAPAKVEPVATVEAVPAGPASASSEPASPLRCTLAGGIETVDDGRGKAEPHGTENLEDLRILADGDTVVMTWERQSDYDMGDSWRAPVIAERERTTAFRVQSFPVQAYACATNGYIGPLSKSEHAVTWGVNNAMAFEVWPNEPQTTEATGAETMKTRPVRSRPSPRQSMAELVTSPSVALASTYDHACDVPCQCPGAERIGLWLFPLASVHAKAWKLATPKSLTPPLAPALAMAEDGGAAAYRSDGALHLVWLDRAGAPVGAPVRVVEGDVGAPAVAISGSTVVVAWARRAAKTAPYAIEWLTVAHGAIKLPASRALVTTESAFAPAVLTDGKDAVFAWMQGDGARSGTVYAARMAFDGAAPTASPLTVSAPGDTNARDPELSGTVDAPVLAHAAFSKSRPGGVARLARLTCGR